MPFFRGGGGRGEGESVGVGMKKSPEDGITEFRARLAANYFLCKLKIPLFCTK